MLNLIYNYLFIFLIIYLTISANKKFFKFNDYVYILSLFFHLTLTITYIKLFPISDWDSYLWYANFGIKELASVSFFSTHFINTLIVVLQKFLFLKQINVILIFSIMSFFGIVIFINNLVKLGFEKKYACLLLFIPSIHFWTGIPGKDALILFCLSCFFSFYIDRKLLISSFFILIVFLVRPHIGSVFFVSIALAELILVKGLHKKLSIVILTSLFIFGLLYFKRTQTFFLGTADPYTNTFFFSDNIFYQMLSHLNALSQKYPFSNSAYTSGNILINTFNYLVFPIELIFRETSKILTLSILLEIFTFIFVIGLILKNKQNVNIDKRIVYFLLFSVIIFCLILPQTFFNFGINIRQKWMILPFLIYLSLLARNLFVKTNKI